MTDLQKALVGALASLCVGLATGAVGYLYRDSFDAPRLSLELVQYEITRGQCSVSPNVLYLFKTAHSLRKRIEDALPWSLSNDLRDDEVEYKNTEDLLRILPQRRKYLERELPFIEQQQKLIADFLANPSPERQNQTKSTIAYIAGVGSDSSKSTDALLKLYEDFDRQPAEFAKILALRLTGWKRSVEQEVELIPPLIKELDTCYRAGKPPPVKMIGNNLDEMPNVTFQVSTSNSGRTDGRISHVMTFESNGANPYRINLIGQNPQFNTATSPTSWARLTANRTDLLAYTIDKVRNQPEAVKSFYADLTSERGISGLFAVKDIAGRRLTFAAKELGPIN